MTGLKNTCVVGGPSKLFSNFIKDQNVKSLITFADLRYGSGNGYSHFMTELSSTPPNYFYFHKNSNKLYSRNTFQKHKLKEFNSYSEEKTEWEIMRAEGYDRIWDCGNAKFEYIASDI